MKRTYLVAALGLCSIASYAQEQKWNVGQFRGPSQEVPIQTDEGTWMNLDVSPDGKEIVFDLLGDIYIMPIQGGAATKISGGIPFEFQPRFSPDGQWVAFTSDAGGGDNIWVMKKDGSAKKQITKESFRLLNNAAWHPNGQYIIARKHFTATRSLGAGEMWMYSIQGNGDGVQLTKRKNDQQDSGEPTVSPDGKYVYFSEDITPGPIFQYSKDPNGTIYAIKQLDLSTGKLNNFIATQGGAVRPQVSKNGEYMAFVKRVRLKSVLYVQNIKTGQQWPVYDDLSHDQQETWAINGVYPNFQWMPDHKTLVFYAKGKIRNVNIETLKTDVIPFMVDTKVETQNALRFEQKVYEEEFTSKMLRQLNTSPDGQLLVFNAAGYLYKKDLKTGKVERLTKATDFEYEPSFSPDGKFVVYINWNDELKGSIRKIDLKSGKITQITDEKGYYYSPKFNHKGDKIVYRKGPGNDVLGFTYGRNTGIFISGANGGLKTFVMDNGLYPQFNASDDRLFFQSSSNGLKALKSVNLSGADEQVHYTSKYARAFSISPDNKFLAFKELYHIYVTPFVQVGVAQDASASNRSIPMVKVTKEGGDYMHWSNDGKKLFWTLGENYYQADVNAADGSVKTQPNSIPVNLKLKSDAPEGLLALTGARIISMNGDEVIEEGTILIDGNKILAVGKLNEVQVPENAKVVNVTGKTIMPGMIDVHAHLRPSPDGVTPQSDWSYMANLAFGVTTSHDPSTNTEMVFSQSEMLKAGRLIGPRVYSTGGSIYGADGDSKVVINSYEDAYNALKRLKDVGAFSIKSYNQPRREQRQQILEAARNLNMLVVPEGGSNYLMDVSMVIDGHTGIEHSIPVHPLYKDVKALWAGTKSGYTPTLIVAFGVQWGENYWFDRTNVWENEKLLSFVPRSIVDARSRRRTTSEFGDYGHIEIAKGAKALSDAGVKVNLGAHGQMQGIGAHWELWMFVQGGMSPLQAIRSATLNGAHYLGMDKELGSLQKGKLADLVIMDSNPLEDIRNTEKIKYVMVNGRLFDSATLNEVGTRVKQRGKLWFESENANSFDFHNGAAETHTYSVPECD